MTTMLSPKNRATETKWRERPDIASSSDDYARRFAGQVGRYFLECQWQAVVRALPATGPLRILDVGGGHAQLAVPLVRAGHSVTIVGSDARCRRRLARELLAAQYNFVQAELTALPFAPQSFDVVIAVRMLAHLTAWPRFLAELCRVAKQRVIVDYAARCSVNAWAALGFGWKRRVEGNTRAYACHGRRELREAFRRQGFSICSAQPQFLLPMALHRLGRSAWLSRRSEGLARRVGMTAVFGSPVVLAAVRDADLARTAQGVQR